MEEIKALNDSAGQSILSVLIPTSKIFARLLHANQSTILSPDIRKSTVSYGSHPRQQLDIYQSLSTASIDEPILIYFYGGGLSRGEKNLPGGLVYHNLGTFFASRGLVTIVPDYRRVDSDFGGESAVWPSGAQDLSLVLSWLETWAGKNKQRDVFIMGNSAGGVHVSTFLFGEDFLEQRLRYVDGAEGLVLKGLVELGVPFHFEQTRGREDVLRRYYGEQKDIRQKCPLGMLEAVAKGGKSRREIGVPKVLALLGEFDPIDEIGNPMKDFVALWEKTWGEGIEFEILKGHNHISPSQALLSGDAAGEKWGEDVVKWIKAFYS